jgi:hypothetical protein
MFVLLLKLTVCLPPHYCIRCPEMHFFHIYIPLQLVLRGVEISEQGQQNEVASKYKHCCPIGQILTH